jgi:hypothetical protein
MAAAQVAPGVAHAHMMTAHRMRFEQKAPQLTAHDRSLAAHRSASLRLAGAFMARAFSSTAR